MDYPIQTNSGNFGGGEGILGRIDPTQLMLRKGKMSDVFQSAPIANSGSIAGTDGWATLMEVKGLSQQLRMKRRLDNPFEFLQQHDMSPLQ